MSYFAFLDAWGMFNNRGAIISQKVWENSFFVLPFRLSFEVSSFNSEDEKRITARQTNGQTNGLADKTSYRNA